MSVSVFVELGEASGFQVSCYCPEAQPEVFGTYDEAYSYALSSELNQVVFSGCELPDVCPYEPVMVNAVHDTSDAPYVNMSSKNAVDVFSTLGVNLMTADDWAGTFDAADLYGRITLALGVTDESLPTDDVTYGNVVECGRRQGYVQDKLQELRTVVEYAQQRGRLVCWS